MVAFQTIIIKLLNFTTLIFLGQIYKLILRSSTLIMLLQILQHRLYARVF